MTEFSKFPSTPHLIWLGVTPPRDDKVLARQEADAFLANHLVVEEKVDGANVGFSFSDNSELRIQNRGQYLSHDSRGQFRGIWKWARQREAVWHDVLSDVLILFGEWCYARHSIRYDHLPDWFLGFDVYDRSCGRFWSTLRRDQLLETVGLVPVAHVAAGKFDRDAILEFLRIPSRYAETTVEGVYVRRENADFLLDRAKVVNAGFVSGIKTHWSKAPMVVNERRAIYR
jgi:hypothetical protein